MQKNVRALQIFDRAARVCDHIFAPLDYLYLLETTSDSVTRVNDSTCLESRFLVTLTRLESR